NLIVDAMIGRDFLGYDPNPSQQASGTNPAYNRWDPNNQRRTKYIDPAAVSASKNTEPVKDAFGPLGATPPAATDPATPTIDNTYCPVFLDKFEWPILYYRANPSATQRNWILPNNWNNTNNTAANNSVYNGLDNRTFTDHQISAQPGQHHEINKASVALTGAD